MKAASFDWLFLWGAGFLVVTGSLTGPIRAAEETEIKDESGKTIIRYDRR